MDVMLVRSLGLRFFNEPENLQTGYPELEVLSGGLVFRDFMS